LHVLIATNLALESVFLVTFRPEAAQAPIKVRRRRRRRQLTLPGSGGAQHDVNPS